MLEFAIMIDEMRRETRRKRILIIATGIVAGISISLFIWSLWSHFS